jgi:hypothetical protein
MTARGWHAVALGVSGAAAVAGLGLLAFTRRRSGLLGLTVQVGKKKIPEGQSGKRPVGPGYMLTLTPTQAARIFPGLTEPPRDAWKRAKCGVWGCAYVRGPAGTPEHGQVVKFTVDEDEARVALRVKQRPVQGVARVVDVVRLMERRLRPGKGSPVFAIIAQRYAPPGKIARIVGNCAGHRFAAWRGGAPGGIIFPSCIRSRAEREGVSPDAAIDFAMLANEAVDGLSERGVEWVDFHPGNVTQDEHGDPVIIDLGPYYIEDKPGEEVAELAAPKRPRYGGR